PGGYAFPAALTGEMRARDPAWRGLEALHVVRIEPLVADTSVSPLFVALVDSVGYQGRVYGAASVPTESRWTPRPCPKCSHVRPDGAQSLFVPLAAWESVDSVKILDSWQTMERARWSIRRFPGVVGTSRNPVALADLTACGS